MNDRPVPTEFGPYKYEEFVGLPPDGEHGFFVGYEGKDGRPHLLRWSENDQCWLSVTICNCKAPKPQANLLTGENASRIARWARLPWVQS